MEISERMAFHCCSSRTFASVLSKGSPYADSDAMMVAARRAWWEACNVRDWLEAFDAHPKIGDVDALKHASGEKGACENQEQGAAIATATEQDLDELAQWNWKYVQKFGHLFLIYASGKTADDVKAAIKTRYSRSPCVELFAAAGEQMKITEDRLRGLLGLELSGPDSSNISSDRSPSITTHVLDTCRGCPAAGVPLSLQKPVGPSQLAFEDLASGTTGENGRASLAKVSYLSPGKYRLKFRTGDYLKKCRERFPEFYKEVAFYPEANIDFEITPEMCEEHFHIPLLLSPYGYTTYRGS